MTSSITGNGSLPAFPPVASASMAMHQIPDMAMHQLPGMLAAPLPPRLTKKIIDLEYVDMAELVPDTWRYGEEDGSKCCHQSRRSSRRAPVTDILLWLECYTTMAAILVSQYPSKAAELLAYQRTILCAHRDFEGTAWVTYDTCYRRQAAAKKSLDWSQMDFSLYNQTFAGRAKAKSRCRYCLSEYHRAEECYYAPEPYLTNSAPHLQGEVNTTRRLPLESSPVGRPPWGTRSQTQMGSQTKFIEICELFNNEKGNMCRFKKCKYMHMCINKGCHGPHPASECTARNPGLRKRPHSPLSRWSSRRS